MKLEIGKNIRKMRRTADMTQEELAERLGVSYQAVSRWENGSTYPDIELLPVLAGMFGCTLDKLVGEAKDDKIRRYYEEADAIPVDDIAAKRNLWRRAFAEFPNEFIFGRFLCFNLAYDSDHDDETIMNELRQVVTGILHRCTDNADIRTGVIEALIWAEKDERLGDFLERYVPAYDISRAKLLYKRCKAHGEKDAFKILAGMNSIDAIGHIFYAAFDPFPTSPATALPTLYAKFDFLNSVIGIDEELRRTHPVYADGVPDAWINDRMYYGLGISCRLASMGKTDEALSMLEETTTLYEKFYGNVKVGTVLSYRVDKTGVTDIVVSDIYNDDGWKHILASSSDENKAAMEAVHLSSIFASYYAVNYYEYLATHEGWEWFDSIREHPRYLACMERVKKAGSME